MFKNKHKVLAVITARGNSKGLVRKNVLDLAGIPLIAWTIKAAHQSKYITKVILSSDDDEIINVAERFDCDVPFRRPSELATDDASSVDVVCHALENIPGYDYVIVLQPTSPLRSAADIDAAFELMISSEANSCVSVCETAKTPYWMYHLGPNKILNRLLPLPIDGHNRQALPSTYELNGAIYILSIGSLLSERNLIPRQTIAYVMDRAISIDIDCLSDFKRCQTYLEEASDV
jgi:CMP-N-acetylneuraminic acid synthetase